MLQRIHEQNEAGLVKIRQQIALRKFNREEKSYIVDQIVKNISALMKKYKPNIKSENYEDILRRLSMLNRQLVSSSANLHYGILEDLRISMSASESVTIILDIMSRQASLIPTVDPITCIVVRQRVAQIISQFITDFINEFVQCKLNEFMSKHQAKHGDGILIWENDSLPSSPSSSSDGNGRVCFDETAKVIEKPEKEEFKKKRAMYSSRVDKIVRNHFF